MSFVLSPSSAFSYDYSEFPEGIYEGEAVINGRDVGCFSYISRITITDNKIIIKGTNTTAGFSIRGVFPKISSKESIKLKVTGGDHITFFFKAD